MLNILFSKQRISMVKCKVETPEFKTEYWISRAVESSQAILVSFISFSYYFF